jgi:hypothetical protein
MHRNRLEIKVTRWGQPVDESFTGAIQGAKFISDKVLAVFTGRLDLISSPG